MHFKKLVGKLCYLSPVDSESAEKWTEWDNDLEVTLPLGDEAYEIFTLGRNQQSIESVMEKNMHAYEIVDLETDVSIGRILLIGMDHVNRTSMLGIGIGDKSYWGRGYGTEAIRLLLEYSFNILNLHSVWLGTFEFNKRAIRCYQKVGFKEIGRRREARIIAGKKYDIVFMDILASELDTEYLSSLLNLET